MYGIEPADSPLDLNELLIHKPSATFFVRAKGDSMKGAGIFDGDLVIIDRSITAKHGHIVLAIVNGDFILRRLYQKLNTILLYPEHPSLLPLNVSEEMDFRVWGVATTCIHYLI